ncbi:ABC transporter permease [Mesorhizobium sp. CAU 1741]|uniref:ABC transporter permease n=1 Tax=Mesorhizobium sp. CAU 1741 TaxID=3140366 RepID=UPI00325B90F6
MRPGERAWTRYLILGLPTAYFIALVAFPLFVLGRMSFSVPERGRVFGDGFSFGNYAEIFANPLFLETLGVTVRIGIIVSLCALAIGFPLALFIWRAKGWVRSLVIFITIAPILISVVVRSYGWIVLLSNRGLVNSTLMYFGVIERPIRLIFNETGIVIGMTHVLLPFMVLSIMSTLQSIDRSLEDAASTLGARPLRVNLEIILPLALPGIVSGMILVFILSVGSFITPVLLGGQMVMTLPILALQQFQTTFNWALGSAIATMLLVAVLLITTVFERLLRKHLIRGAG